jgi:hypothetical protein
MKQVLVTFMMFTAAAFSVQASAHHAAEGIISDELWEMIDDRLEAADSPHLDLDFTMMGNTIVTTVEVDTSMVNDVLATISSVNNGRLMVSTQETGSGMTEIVIVEQVGSGESQIIYQ